MDTLERHLAIMTHTRIRPRDIIHHTPRDEFLQRPIVLRVTQPLHHRPLERQVPQRTIRHRVHDLQRGLPHQQSVPGIVVPVIQDTADVRRLIRCRQVGVVPREIGRIGRDDEEIRQRAHDVRRVLGREVAQDDAAPVAGLGDVARVVELKHELVHCGGGVRGVHAWFLGREAEAVSGHGRGYDVEGRRTRWRVRQRFDQGVNFHEISGGPVHEEKGDGVGVRRAVVYEMQGDGVGVVGCGKVDCGGKVVEAHVDLGLDRGPGVVSKPIVADGDDCAFRGSFDPWWDRNIGCEAGESHFEFGDGDEMGRYADLPGCRR